MATKAPNNLLDLKTPIVRLGRKMMAVENREWQGNPQTSISEVAAVVDPTDQTKVAGWTPVFKGTRFQGTPDDVKAFLEGCLAKLSKKA